MSRNWAEIGIEWTARPVSRQPGDNATDRIMIGQAQLPVLKNTELAIKAGLGAAILKGVNGTSWTVQAQDQSRRMIEKGVKDVETMRERIFSRLQSIGHAFTTTVIKEVEKRVEVIKHMLPDGTEFTGDVEIEYRQEYMVQLVDMEVPTALAAKLAEAQAW